MPSYRVFTRFYEVTLFVMLSPNRWVVADRYNLEWTYEGRKAWGSIACAHPPGMSCPACDPSKRALRTSRGIC